ncbi:MAG: hypothetical protein HYV14_10470 [Elusimicrobia bacterium]|nr:hypothetical protein [Elusimicrobiota bacterium]
MKTAIMCLMLSAVPAAAAVMSPKEFETEAKKWVEEAKAVASLDCAAMHDIWYAGCAADLEGAADRDLVEAKAAADKAGSAIPGKVQAALSKYKSKLEPWMTKNKSNPPTYLKPLVAEVAHQLTRVNNLALSKLRGSNHPWFQQAAKYGVSQHKNMQDMPKFGCVGQAQPFNGALPDCVSPAQCMIYEFKPDNDAAKKKGEGQLRDYKPKVDDYYLDAINSGSVSVHGGAAAIAAITKNSKCYSGGKVAFGVKVEPYKMCVFSYNCGK